MQREINLKESKTQAKRFSEEVTTESNQHYLFLAGAEVSRDLKTCAATRKLASAAADNYF